MARLYSNNFTTTLASAATDSDTTLTVTTATGLPAVGGGDTCRLTLATGGTIEIVEVTAVSGTDLTVTRAQESTTAVAWAAGSLISLRPTADSFGSGGGTPGGSDTQVQYNNAGAFGGISTLTFDGTTLTGTGTYDFGGATSLEIPNSATPTVNADGEVAIDTTVTDFSAGVMKYYSAEEMGVVAMPIGEFTTPTDGHVVAYNATNDEFELVAQSGGGTPGGSNTEIQYNNAGSFGGLSTLTTDGTDLTFSAFFDNSGSTGALRLPNGTTAQRPTGANGMIRYNSTLFRLEMGFTSSWSGGQILIDGDFSSTGIMTRTGSGSYAGRTITGTSNEIEVTNGNGVSGNPTLSLPSTIDLGGKTSLEIPNSASPTVNADGEIAVDTTVTDFSAGVLKYYSGEEMGTVAMPIAEFTSPTDGHVVTYNATNDEFELAAAAGGGTDTTTSAFKAYRNTTQSITAVTHTKVQLNTENYDYDGTFDSTTNYRHTPTTAGKYLYFGTVLFLTPTDGAQLIPEPYKNGAVVSQTTISASGTAAHAINYIALIEMNGTTDYVELYVYRDNTGNIGSASGGVVSEFSCHMGCIYVGA